MSPRAHIERHFAWLKRYCGLKYFRVQGYFAVTQFVFRVYIAALIVAFTATRHQRPELATLRLKVLAFITLSVKFLHKWSGIQDDTATSNARPGMTTISRNFNAIVTT